MNTAATSTSRQSANVLQGPSVETLRSQATERVWRFRNLTPSARLVLLAMCRRVYRGNNLGWICSPSQVGIAEDAGVTRRTVQRVIDDAIAAGLLTALAPRRYGDTLTYTILAKLPEPAHGVTVSPPCVKKSHTERVTMSHDQENFSSPSTNRKLESTAAEAAVPKAAAAAIFSPGSVLKTERKPETREPDPLADAIRATVQAHPELAPRLLQHAPQFASTLRERGVSVVALEDAITLTMERRRERSARDSISSLRYFLPAINEVIERGKTGGHDERRQHTQTYSRNRRTDSAAANDGVERDWRGFPVIPYHYSS